MQKDKLCPACGKKTEKVLYMGVPMRLCTDKVKCSTVFGFWAFIMFIVPFNGMFLVYEGSYFSALWHFLKGVETE